MNLFLRTTIAFFLGLGLQFAQAQDNNGPSTIKGKIVDEITNEPIVDAVIEVKGTNDAVSTDTAGNYALTTSAKPPFVLRVLYSGYSEKLIDIYEIEPELNISLRVQDGLSDVVITAVGLETNKKSIEYTLTEIKGKEITSAREANLTTALSGKIAGVQVTNSGGSPGGGSIVRIRGNSSILGNNNPIYIIDGVPIDNSTNDLQSNLTNSVSLATPSNRLIDINQEDIENMTVLKGPAAAALYGIRAANGAVIINTKKGRKLTDKKFTAFFNYSIQADRINCRVQPRQRKYSNGFGGQYIAPGGTNSSESWGALIDTLVYAPGTTSPFYQGGQIVGKSSAPNGKPIELFDNIDNFFQTGITQNLNAGIAGNLDKAGYYLSVGRLYQTGVIPTTDFFRTTVRFNADYDLSTKLKASAGVNYINDGANNRALQGGYGTNVVRALINSNDVFDITNGSSDPANDPSSYQYAPTAASPWAGSRNYSGGVGWNSPYWSLNNNPQKDENNRFIAYTQLDYQILPWLKATFRPGIDTYVDKRNSGFANGSNGVGKGIINIINFNRRDVNTDLILSAKRDLSKDIDLTVNLGHNYWDTYRNQNNVRGDNLTIPFFYNIANAATVQAFETIYNKKLVSVYGNANIGYKKWAYINFSANNTWSSTLPQGKNSLFFPSAGGSFIFTEAFKIKCNILSFGKLRGTYARVGNDSDPYSLNTYYNNLSLTQNSLQSVISGPFAGNPAVILGNTSLGVQNSVGNPNLLPESIRSWEFGTELRFLKNRVGLDLVYYDNLSTNQIVPVSLPSSTGYRAAVQNSGSVSNKGVELALNATPIKSKDFTWDISLIYYKYVSKVLSLAQGLDNISIGTAALADNRAWVGQPYSVLVGSDVKRNASGQPIIDDAKTLANGSANPNYGYPLINASPTIIGDPNPDGVASLRNAFTYKGLTLSFLLDTRWGFDLQNSPRQQMVFNGIDASTENRGQSTVFSGVKASDGSSNDIPAVASQAWYRSTFNYPGLYVEKDLYFIKLRDISIAYELPSKWIKSIGASRASISVYGRNFLLKTNYSGNDPDLSIRTGQQNGFGADFWSTPNTKSYGVNLNVTF